MHEPPLEPHTERLTYEECSFCNGSFIFHDEEHGYNPSVRFAWWDKDKEFPFCRQECMFDYNKMFNKNKR